MFVVQKHQLFLVWFESFFWFVLFVIWNTFFKLNLVGRISTDVSKHLIHVDAGRLQRVWPMMIRGYNASGASSGSVWTCTNVTEKALYKYIPLHTHTHPLTHKHPFTKRKRVRRHRETPGALESRLSYDTFMLEVEFVSRHWRVIHLLMVTIMLTLNVCLTTG